MVFSGLGAMNLTLQNCVIKIKKLTEKLFHHFLEQINSSTKKELKLPLAV